MQACLSIYDLLFHSARTKNYEAKVGKLELKKLKEYRKIANEKIFNAFTYLFMDFILLWYKIT